MTLTQTARFTKTAIVISIVTIVLAVSGFIGYKIWYAHYLASLPPIEEKPDLKFGALPPVDLPPSKISSDFYTYTLATETGGLPSFDKLVKVYFMPPLAATFLAVDKSQTLASKFNIQTTGQPESETRFLYAADTRSLTINVDSGNLSYVNSATPSANQTLAGDDILLANFKSLLNNLGVLKDPLSDTHTKVALLKIQDGHYVPAAGRFEAQAAKLYLWPNDINKKQILTPGFDTSIISAEATSSAQTINDYNSVNFTYWPIDTSTFATYPLKPIETAFDELKSGKGTIIDEPTSRQVSITSVYLAYYEDASYNQYLQPIYVFEGQGFVSYVPAIGQ